MLTSGDVLEADLGIPSGHEAGFARPVVVVTAQRILDQGPTVVHVVPLTSTLGNYPSEVVIVAEASGLNRDSAAQCQHIRAISSSRLANNRGNVGAVDLRRIREMVTLILDAE